MTQCPIYPDDVIRVFCQFCIDQAAPKWSNTSDRPEKILDCPFCDESPFLCVSYMCSERMSEDLGLDVTFRSAFFGGHGCHYTGDLEWIP